LRLDYLYYLSRLINPVDQILEVLFGLKDFTKNHFNDRLLKVKLTRQVNELFAPRFEVEKDRLYLIKNKNKYQLIYGSKSQCKEKLKLMDDSNQKILKHEYTPISGLYWQLKRKYGPTSTLKTRFIFKDSYILLGDIPESKLISTIKKEFK